jgi:hypothetical protein
MSAYGVTADIGHTPSYRPPFIFERNTLGSNGSLFLRFIASPLLPQEEQVFYNIAPNLEDM